MSDEEKKAIQYLNKYCDTDLLYEQRHYNYIKMIIRLVGKQSKEIEELIKKNKPQSDCEEPIERTEEMVNMKWVNHNYISKDKIKAKIEEIDIEIQCCEYADDDIEEYKQDMEKEKSRLLRDKKVLQSLLEKE